MGKNCFFLTNNATKLQADVGAKMAIMGYKNIKQENIYTTAYILPKYLASNSPLVRKVFAIGMSAVRTSLEAEGIQVIGADEHVLSPEVQVNEVMFDNLELDPEVGAVVFGLDMSFTH